MRILIVDDEPNVLTVISEFLKDCGYETLCAANGMEALDCLERQQPIDLILSDVRMPHINGIEFLRAVQVRFPGMPTILITGHGDEKIAVNAFNDGAYDYLKKPIKFEVLLNRIERLEGEKSLENRLHFEYESLFRRSTHPQNAAVNAEYSCRTLSKLLCELRAVCKSCITNVDASNSNQILRVTTILDEMDARLQDMRVALYAKGTES